ncbi:LysM domain-containing protein [Cylindrospermum stagnale PCC 7417]|uniref:LysM domain-containing protein n=1 Tax=Cylindrospermum stagnale PCC 7417 TaxID=56107 RepID=K9WRJ2_9NOST|nr:LysM peptidoglycan-binding domain-containing protein [Cylindrospermum stagnale]AFZ23000.1 LysM domain-containing protein [Cylindrospermum stagnale PCC 7417]
MEVCDPAVVIPEGTALSIPKVQGGFFVDHSAANPGAIPRTNTTDKEVPPNYRNYWPNSSSSQDGSKQGKNIQEASLWDYPGGGPKFHIGFNFETVARSEDVGIDYGTIHWNFKLQSGTVKDESFHVEKGTSETFQAGLQEFNKFYKNPHTVMKGETLANISKNYYGKPDRWQDIYKANKDIIKDQNNIKPGLKLRIPDFSA